MVDQRTGGENSTTHKKRRRRGLIFAVTRREAEAHHDVVSVGGKKAHRCAGGLGACVSLESQSQLCALGGS